MVSPALPAAAGIELLFADEDLVVANKPSGLLVHRGWDDDDDVALFRVRDAVGAHVHVVHRLDRATSGVLVFARHRDAAATLCGGGRYIGFDWIPWGSAIPAFLAFASSCANTSRSTYIPGRK